mmetsp:Transcript_7792/g.9080  ORF Transcript_7792/g.9080 Transcript_7792/m.9080 type:complete len:155 (+) Transcript_7792:128-592(+)
MNDEGNRKRVKMGDDALIGEDNPSPNRIECSVALAPVIESAEDAMDRKRVIADHKERRSRMLAKHMEEVKSFELVCSQDLGPGFSTCNVVKKSREARRRAASAGFCCVCKTELLVMNVLTARITTKKSTVIDTTMISKEMYVLTAVHCGEILCL